MVHYFSGGITICFPIREVIFSQERPNLMRVVLDHLIPIVADIMCFPDPTGRLSPTETFEEVQQTRQKVEREETQTDSDLVT
jgi:hypothetical protein